MLPFAKGAFVANNEATVELVTYDYLLLLLHFDAALIAIAHILLFFYLGTEKYVNSFVALSYLFGTPKKVLNLNKVFVQTRRFLVLFLSLANLVNDNYKTFELIY